MKTYTEVKPISQFSQSPADRMAPAQDSPEFDQWVCAVKKQMVAALRKRNGR